jgi:DNA-binding transcriptional regulator YiaG
VSKIARSEVRRCREALGLSQTQFARALRVSTETYRTWDSGRRRAPQHAVARARKFTEAGPDVPVALYVLAAELGIHVRTLRAAAADGRMRATFTTKSYFGKAIARATRTAALEFLRRAYGKSARQLGCTSPVASAPADYAARILGLRRRLHLTQAGLAKRIGAANKAVVYQWEAATRKPSPLFWARLLRLGEHWTLIQGRDGLRHDRQQAV